MAPFQAITTLSMSLWFALAAFCIPSHAQKASSLPRYVLTSSEFQRLSPDKKKQWIDSLQIFMTRMEKIERRTPIKYSLYDKSHSRTSWTLWSGLFLTVSNSWAEESENLNREQLLIKKLEQDNLALRGKATLLKQNYVDDTVTPGSRQYWEKHVAQALEKAANYNKQIEAYDQKHPQAKTGKADPQSYDYLLLQKVKAENDLLQLLEKAQGRENDHYYGFGNDKKERIEKARKNLATAENHLKNLKTAQSTTCVYAGWLRQPIRGSAVRCPQPQEMILQTEQGLLQAYSCKDNAKAPVVCNPLVFGLQADRKPFCISGKKNSMQECQEKAQNSPNPFANVVVAAEYPTEYNRLSEQVVRVCKSDKKKHLQDLGMQGEELRQGIQDLDENCELLQGSLSEIEKNVRHGGSKGST